MTKIRRALSQLFDRLPPSVQVRLLPSAFGLDRKAVPPPITPPEGRVRLLIAPANYAGQAFEWSRAAERLSGVGAVNMVTQPPNGFGFSADYEVSQPVYLWSRPWQRRQFHAVIAGFTHVIIEAQRPIFGLRFGRDQADPWTSTAAEVDALHRSGVKTAMLCHGSDIRLPSRHAANEPESPFAERAGRTPAYAQTRELESIVIKNRALLTDVGGPVFVSTPDLLIDVPDGIWLPLVVSEDWFRLDVTPPLQRARPIVAHVPSRGALKGSDLIDETVQRLHDEGLIEYDRREGVSHAGMTELYGGADIVLEQFSLGLYSVAACEALAAGRLVISHVSDQVRQHVASVTGHTVPIVQSRAADLERTIRDALQNRDRYRAIASEGPGFVRAVHDGRLSAEVLERTFLSR